MLVRLHSQATTTPKIRAAIQASDEPAWALAERHGTTEQTVWKWRKRDRVLSQSFFGRENGRVLDKFMRPSWKTV